MGNKSTTKKKAPIPTTQPSTSHQRATSKFLKSITKKKGINVQKYLINDKNEIDLPNDFKCFILKDNDHSEYFEEIICKEFNVYLNIFNYFRQKGFLTDDDLDLMITKYQYFMINYNSKNVSALDNEIKFVWRIHLLHPLLYINDCKKLFGYLLAPSYDTITPFFTKKEIETPTDFNKMKTIDFHLPPGVVPFTNMNLKQSIKNQLEFIKWIYDAWDTRGRMEKTTAVLRYHLSDYKKFLKTAASLLPLYISPTRINDLFWHTHMLFIDNYYYECKYFTNGYVLGHNDINVKQTIQKNIFNFNLYTNVIKKESNLLVYGYIKQNNSKFGLIIPNELINLLLQFYYETPIESTEPESSFVYCSILLYSNDEPAFCITYQDASN